MEREVEIINIEHLVTREFIKYFRRHHMEVPESELTNIKRLFDFKAVQEFVDNDISQLDYREKVHKQNHHKKKLIMLTRYFAHKIRRNGIIDFYRDSDQIMEIHTSMKNVGCAIYPCISGEVGGNVGTDETEGY